MIVSNILWENDKNSLKTKDISMTNYNKPTTSIKCIVMLQPNLYITAAGACKRGGKATYTASSTGPKGESMARRVIDWRL